MKKTLEKHKKKSIIAGFSLATLVTILTAWGQIAPIVCRFTRSPDLCVATGQAAVAVVGQLDNGTDGGQTLDSFLTAGPVATP